MQKRKVGPFEVVPIGLGCMSMSQAYGSYDMAENERVLHRALDIGYDFLDTASLYGDGHNETLIGNVLKDRRSEYVLASKCGIFRDPSWRIDCRPEKIKETCEDSLRRLQTDVIDLYYLHRLDKQVPIEDSVGALADLVQAGKIRAIGLSEVSSVTIRRAHAVHPLAAVQSEYSLWTRVPEYKVFDACRELGITFVPFSPLARGFLSGNVRDMSKLEENDLRHTMPRFKGDNFQKNLKLLDEFEKIAKENHCTMAQLALAWVLEQQDRTLIPIPGTKHVKYVEENFKALDVKLSAADVERLDQLINVDTVAGDRYDGARAGGVDVDD